MEMDIQVERTAEALDQRDGTGLCRRLRVAGFPDQMCGKGPIDDAQHLAHDRRPAGKQKPERVWETQHPFTHRRMRQDFIHQQGRALGHAPRPAARAEATTFATEGHKLLGMAGVATHPQEAMLQPAAAKVIVEFRST